MSVVVSGSRRRFEARRRRRRWRGARPLVLLVLVVVLAGATAWAVWFSSLLSVRRVTVVGVADRSADQPTDRTADQRDGGLDRSVDHQVSETARSALGRPLARIDLREMVGRVEAIAGVASARVSRSWPSTLRIMVVQRQAVAVVERSGSSWLVDEHGTTFQQVSGQPRSLPRLEVTDPDPSDPVTRATLAAVRSLPVSLRARVRSVSASTPESVRMALRDGRSVVWGGADRGDEKARVLQALLHQPGTLYDVSTPSVVVIR